MVADSRRLGAVVDFIWIGDFVLFEACDEERRKSSFINSCSMIPRIYILGFFIKFTLKRIFSHG